MKSLYIYVLISLLPTSVFAQTKTDVGGNNSTYTDLIYTDEINGKNIFASDDFNQIVQKKIEQTKSTIDDPTGHPKVYFVNLKGDRYLKIFGGPDLGYGWFYSIGYTSNGKCADCGKYMGKEPTLDFAVNNGIKLGDDLKQVWQKAHLSYFRKFTFMGIVYFYFEKGVRHEIPFTPNYVYYYKFKNDKLMEIGFGFGMIGVNPMLHSE